MMPQDLVDYLHTMISPGDRVESCVVHIIHDPVAFDWASHADASAHGMIFDSGASTLSDIDHYVAEAYRILKPGAHLLLVAPDEEPTGHTGACEAEDAGFEVRDAILWAYGPHAGDKIHYTAKASRSEREEGLYDTDFDYGQQDESRKEGLPGGDNPRNRGLTKRKNVHPTVKPTEVMVRLLQNVPKDQGPVIDPFLGSGTTLLACLETGHDGIGIERERQYIEIADARVRHANVANAAWDAAIIESDVEPEKAEVTELDFGDLLGL